MKLYKYLKEEKYGKWMVEEGKIRIGTFFDFRKLEKDKQRGDKNEGKITYSKSVEEDTNVKDLPPILTGNLNIEGGGTLILKSGAKASSHGEISDCYLYCASRLHSQDLMKDFKAACCVEIFDVENFYCAIGRTLVEGGYIYEMGIQGDCNYIGHEVGPDFKETSHFLKDKELYGHQAEYRFIYYPLLKDKEGKIFQAIFNKSSDGMQEFGVPVPADFIYPEISYIDITCKDITSFCKLVYL